MPTTILNFAHPLTPAHLDQIRTQREGLEIARVIEIPTHFTDDAPYEGQLPALVDRAGLTSPEWQTVPLLVNPPGYAPITAALLAYIHGLRGEFPELIRLTRAPDQPGVYVVSSLIPLQSIRDAGRVARVEGM